MQGDGVKFVVHIDGGARGNPGPAGAGIVIRDVDGETIKEKGLFLGEATNNVAEYRGLLGALELAGRLGADELHVYSDSELLVRQMIGRYRVRQPHLQKLHAEAHKLVEQFKAFAIEHVRRAGNKDADRLVNMAIDARKDVDG